MSEISLLKDGSFLRALDQDNNKVFYVKLLILDKDELPIRDIEGRVSSGSLTISGSSSTRRAGNLTFLAEEQLNDLTDIDNLLSMNKKVKILIGMENHVDTEHDDIIWFNQGIFVIVQPSLTHSTSGVTISLQIKDKMCLLDGTCGGNLPTSVTFHEYDQIIGKQEISYSGAISSAYPSAPNNYTVYVMSNGSTTSYMMWDATKGWYETDEDSIGSVTQVPQRIYDIIQTAVCNYGGEDIARIIINDLELELKSSVRYVGSDTLYYNTQTGVYTLDENAAAQNEGIWKAYNYNEDCGYVYTDFTYPGELVSAIGDNVCSVLDKITSSLGNYEYFYDINGNFVFQEKKNYLNTQYEPVQKLDADGFLLDKDSYYVDFSNTSDSIYTFDEGSSLISTYGNIPNYSNVKNDYHIWGKNEDGYAIHYHLAVKEKPQEPYGSWEVVAETNDDGEYTGKIHIAGAGETGYTYTPTDWRADLYMQGLEKKSLQQRPDIYEQELLDLFDAIYDMRAQEWKVDIVNHPNDLKYWFDYILPAELFDVSVDAVGTKIYSYQQDNIKKLYTEDIPNTIIINAAATPISQASIIKKCENSGQPYSRVAANIYDVLAIGTAGYDAQETMREMLYQYTDYTSSISITSVPIYYLDVNNRITVHDRASGIDGDYVVSQISLPLDGRNTMSISASEVLVRV